MNFPYDALSILLGSDTYDSQPFFMFEDGRIITYRHFIDDVLSICTSLHTIRERFLVIKAASPVNYVEGYLAAILTGHVGCLGKPDDQSDDFPQLFDKYVLDDEFIEQAYALRKCDPNSLPKLNPNVLCTIAKSSGTVTGQSKLVGLSQKGILEDTFAAMRYYHICEGERCVHILPYWHMFGIVSELFVPLISGATVCLPRTVYSFFSSIKRFEPTFLHLTPVLAKQMAVLVANQSMEFICGTRLKKVLVSGACIDETVCRQLGENGIIVSTAYGLTECSPCVSIMPDWDVRYGTSGKVLDIVEIHIAEDGEIWIKGPHLMLGYVENDHCIETNTVEGWLHTGDIGHVDSDGFLSVTGRKNNVLVLENGEKYIPEPIENEINGITGVIESLLEICNNKNEEILKLIVVCNDVQPNRNQIDRVMKSYGISTFQCVFRPEPLLRNRMGKLIR